MENIEKEVTNPSVPEGGPYPAEYKGWEETTITRKTGETVNVLRHNFLVQVGDRQVECDTLSDHAPKPGTKFGKIIKALLGRDLQPMESVKESALRGRIVRLIFEMKDGYSRIANVLPER
jgi:hypothetical protein